MYTVFLANIFPPPKKTGCFQKRVAGDAVVPWNFPSFAPLVPETLALDIGGLRSSF